MHTVETNEGKKKKKLYFSREIEHESAYQNIVDKKFWFKWHLNDI